MEVSVFVLGFVGFCVSIVVLGGLLSDRRNVLRAGRNGINKRLVYGDIRNEISRTYKLLCYAIIALGLMAVPPPVRESNAFISRFIAWMLISFELIAFTNTVWCLRDRRKNIRDLRHIHSIIDEHIGQEHHTEQEHVT